MEKLLFAVLLLVLSLVWFVRRGALVLGKIHEAVKPFATWDDDSGW